MRLLFYTDQGDEAGGMNIYLRSPPQYFIHYCIDETNFPAAFPTETDKVWKITLSRVSGIRLVIHCNNVEVLDMVLSDSTCVDHSHAWNTYWSMNMKKIYFYWDDTASDFYSKTYHRSPELEGSIINIHYS